MAEVFIFDAVRSPRGRGKANGSLHTIRPVELLVELLKAIKERNHLEGQTALIDDVVTGCVTQIGDQGQCIARTAVLLAGYDDSVPGVTMNRFCGSGLEAINHAFAMVASGAQDLVLAGGVESMSRVSMLSDDGALRDPSVQFQLNTVPQGISADLIATLWGYSREDVDAFALRSQENAAKAWARGAFQKSIIPIRDMNGLLMLDHDEHMRPDTTMEALASLRPSFLAMGTTFGFDAFTKEAYPDVKEINHVHHAGNASGIVDGASLVLIGTKGMGEKLGLRPRARIKSVAVSGSEPIIMLTGPVPATKKALSKAKMEVSDIHHFEINEAFAAVPLMTMDELHIHPEKVNPEGGAIAMGHPLGATGAMLLGTALDSLEEKDQETALITLCIGSGMGIATIIERV